MKKLEIPDPDDIKDDYDPEDFLMRQQDWAVIGKLAVYGGAAFIIIVCLLRLFGVA